ncbi:MAG: ChaN family lipoprotein [Myxococcota bacterium]
MALHRRIWRRQKAEIDASVAGYTRSFRSYEATYRRRVGAHLGPISYDDVSRRAREADIVYVGDYHTLKQSQKAYLKLVQRCLGWGRPVGLALELFQGAHQGHLDAWLKGRISEATLLRRVGFAGHHFFPIWPNFRPILETARDQGLPILAIDKSGNSNSLHKRDAYAADRIARWAKENPDRRIHVLTGQLHVAPDHLPRAVEKALGRLSLPTRRYLVVYQNCAEIYWSLTAQGLEHTVEAVGVGPEEICLINTSPIIAQQSYLNHLNADDPLDEELETAPERTFKDICRVLCNFLEIEPGDALDQVAVYSLGDLSFLETLSSERKFSRRELAYMKRQILASESYYIPRVQVVYLANLSVNHAAEEAAHFLRHLATEDDGDRHGLVDAFYARTLNEALAFFGSKIVNPRRKCHHRAQLQELDDLWSGDERAGLRELDVQAARMTLLHLDLERGVPSRQVRHLYGEPDPDLFNAVTHLLGYILGDKLYYAMIAGKITKAEIRELFADPFDEEGAAFHTYFHLSSKVGRVRVPARE